MEFDFALSLSIASVKHSQFVMYEMECFPYCVLTIKMYCGKNPLDVATDRLCDIILSMGIFTVLNSERISLM